jgi:hypothetical protein
MALNLAYLQLESDNGGGGPRCPQTWTLLTTDAATVVNDPEYFATALNVGIRLGDWLKRTTVNSLTAPTSVTSAGLHVFTTVSATAIQASETTALTVTESD